MCRPVAEAVPFLITTQPQNKPRTLLEEVQMLGAGLILRLGQGGGGEANRNPDPSLAQPQFPCL
jgi:hypothetical protein